MSQTLVKKSQNLNSSDKKLQISDKRHKTVNFGDQMSQTSEKKTQKYEFEWQKVTN